MPKKKKYGVLIGIIALLTVLLIILTVSLFLNKSREKEPEISEPSSSVTTQTTAEETTAAAETTVPSPLYILGEWEGKLAVYTAPATSAPDKVYDVFLTSLPAEEQQRLKNGIPIYDEQQLQRLLEDYTS